MIVVDVNLLMYAVVRGFEQHDRARAWWERLLNGSSAVGLATPVLFGFLRLSTNRGVLVDPLPIDEALGHVREWLRRPNLYHLVSGPRHLETSLDLLAGLGAGANLTTDVQIAAHAMVEGGVIHSNDSDFGRFPGVPWIDPLREGRARRRAP